MANEDEVTFTPSMCCSNGTLDLNDELMDSIIELMKVLNLLKPLMPTYKKKIVYYWLKEKTLSKS